MTGSIHDDARQAERLASRVSALLGGNPPHIQGAVLADCLATWLAGHIDVSNEAGTDQMREMLLEMHVATVRLLVPINLENIVKRS